MKIVSGVSVWTVTAWQGYIRTKLLNVKVVSAMLRLYQSC